MNNTKYIGMDVHRESISIAVLNSAGKIVMECVIETKASIILQFIDGLRGEFARHLGGRNLGRLVVRPVEAARHQDWWCAIRERMPP